MHTFSTSFLSSSAVQALYLNSNELTLSHSSVSNKLDNSKADTKVLPAIFVWFVVVFLLVKVEKQDIIPQLVACGKETVVVVNVITGNKKLTFEAIIIV